MRPLSLCIDLSALRNNYRYLKKLHGNKLIAVLKADAYGHGSVACADALADEADGFAVAFLDEAIALRQLGITQPIVLLEGLFSEEEYAECEHWQLTPVIHCLEQVQILRTYSWKKPIHIWLKLDTNMHRLGFLPAEYIKVFQELKSMPVIKDIVHMTHFFSADEPNSADTIEQMAIFDQTCVALGGEQSMANSAGILSWQQSHRDWGRAGIALYGVSPFMDNPPETPLSPVMTMQAEVFATRTIKAGERIGYGGIFRANKDMRIGLVAVGYADGYPRIPSNDNPVLIDKIPSRIVGRVCMDMLSVELNHPQQGIGSMVELFGKNILVNEIAKRSGTIGYEVLCHTKRARRKYYNN